LAHDSLGIGRAIPEGWVFDTGIEFIKLTKGNIPVKDAS
jgi:hypothetical protein